MSNANHTVIDRDGFRLRGTAGSRIDSFSDVVFGFALTLLVVSLEVPKTYDQLHVMLQGFFPFAISFLLLMLVWQQHYLFFRRFGLEDLATFWLNALLLFVVLFYVYPLKFLFTIALSQTDGHVFSGPLQSRNLMILYGVGFAAVYGLLALLNYQGWRQRHKLNLSRIEEILTQSYIQDSAVIAGIGLLSCGVALVLPSSEVGWTGMTYFLIAIYSRILHARRDKKLRALREGQRSAEAAE